MTRDRTLETLRRHADDLKSMGAARLYLFGSTAANAARLDSDVDLFLDFEDPHFSLIELLALREHISDLLSASADVMTRGGIHPHLRPEIENAALRVY